MAYCRKCGKQIEDHFPYCPYCGASQDSGVKDKGGFLWGLLGCCIPIAGLILYLVWKDTQPKTAKAAGTGALVGLLLIVSYYVLVVGFGILIAVLNACTSSI